MVGCSSWRAGAVAACLFAIVTGWGGPASALDQIPIERPVRVAVAPASFQVYGALQDEVSNGKLGEAYREGASNYVFRHDAVFEGVSRRELRRRVEGQPTYTDKLEVAERWAELGVESYKKLRTDEAIEQLEKAVEQYRELGYSLVDPERVAEVAMYLSLSYLNRESNAARPLVLMKRMIRLDPSRVIRKGFYPEKIVNFYQTARREVIEEFESSGPSAARGARLADRTGADLVLFGEVLPENGTYRASLHVYSSRTSGFVGTVSSAVELQGASLRRAANRAVGQLAPCIYRERQEQRETVMESSGRSPWSATLGFVYGTYLQEPRRIRSPFGNLGLQFGGRVSLTEEFALELEGHFLNAQRDYDGVIVRDFNTLRATLGADLGIGVGRFDAGVRAGVELGRVGSLTLCLEQLPPSLCREPENQVTYPAFWAPAIAARPRVRVRVFDAFRLVAASNLSYLFVPEKGPRLNGLLTGEIGVQYRF